MFDKKYVFQNYKNRPYSHTPVGGEGVLGDIEQLESDMKGGNDFFSIKSTMQFASDETLSILNTNMEKRNYLQDPLYQYMQDLEKKIESGEKILDHVNYYHFIHGCLYKIQNRTLKEEDYNLLWTRGEVTRLGLADGVYQYEESPGNINESVFERYATIQKKYKTLDAEVSFSSIFNNHTSNRELSGHFGSKLIDAKKKLWSQSEYIILSRNMGLKESLEYLENSFDEIKTMFDEGTSSKDIGLYLKDKNYKQVIDIKKSLGKYGKDIIYSNMNNEYILWTSDSGHRLASGNSFGAMIIDFVSKKRLFDQKPLFNYFTFDRKHQHKTPTFQLQKIISTWESYEQVHDFWFGENNAQALFDKPSSAYGLHLMDIFTWSECETSANILLKLMADNGNEWVIAEDKVGHITKNNLLKIGAIVIEDGFVKFTDSAIEKIRNRYLEQRGKAFREYNSLGKLFTERGIVLPVGYEFKPELLNTKANLYLTPEILKEVFAVYMTSPKQSTDSQLVDILTDEADAPILSKDDAIQAFTFRWYNAKKIKGANSRKFTQIARDGFILSDNTLRTVEKVSIIKGEKNIPNSEAKHNLGRMTELPTATEREQKEYVYTIFINGSNCGELVMD